MSDKLTCVNGNYRISCGYEMRDGVRRPKIIYLGRDERVARLSADTWRMNWKWCVNEMTARGGTKTEAVWTPAFLANAEKLVTGNVQRVASAVDLLSGDLRPVQSAPRPSAPAAERFTLSGAVSAFLAKLASDVRSGERSHANASRYDTSLKQFLRFVAERPYVATTGRSPSFDEPKLGGMPIADLTYEHIAAFRANIANRELSGYAPYTIKTTVDQTRDFLNWLDESGKWRASFNFDRILRVKVSKLITPAEQRKAAAGKDTFTVDELRLLYAHATDQQKLYTLLALNLCITQKQIADLVRDDVTLDTGVVEFVRNKTRSISPTTARFKLWPETLKLLKARLESQPKAASLVDADRLLVSEDGLPLLHWKRAKTDSVKLSFERLLKVCGAKRGVIRWLPFGTLRKTTATWVLELVDEPTQQLALAHSRKSVAGKHYTGAADYSRLDRAMSAIHTKLKPLFAA